MAACVGVTAVQMSAARQGISCCLRLWFIWCRVMVTVSFHKNSTEISVSFYRASDAYFDKFGHYGLYMPDMRLTFAFVCVKI